MFIKSSFLFVFFLLVCSVCLAESQPAPVKPGAPAHPAPVSKEYRINSGDVLDISVWKEEGLTKDVLVRPDGGISFPLIGDLFVQGATVDDVTGQIIERLSTYLTDPVVTVAIKHSNQKFYVVGKVNKPGDIMSPSPLTVMQALSMAGGLTPFADQDDITVIHKSGNKNISLTFDYSAVSKGEELEQNITLEPGDVIIVR